MGWEGMYRSLVPGKGLLNALRHKAFRTLYVIGALVCFADGEDYTRRMLEKIVHWLIAIGIAGWLIGMLIQAIRFGALMEPFQ